MNSKWRRMTAIQNAMEPEHNFLAWREMFHNNTPVPPSFWRFDGAEQVRPIVRTTLNAHIDLGLWMAYVSSLVGRLDELMLRMHLLAQWGRDIFEALAALGRPKAKAPRTDVQRQLLGRERQLARWEKAEGKRLGERWSDVWEAMRTAELAAQRLAAECCGQDILIPEARADLAACRARLEVLREQLSVHAPDLEYSEPETGTVDSLVAWIRR
jgi:hypothetical protein